MHIEFNANINGVHTKINCLIYLIVCVLFCFNVTFAVIIHVSLKLIKIILSFVRENVIKNCTLICSSAKIT
jgi:hypothetical protein